MVKNRRKNRINGTATAKPAKQSYELAGQTRTVVQTTAGQSADVSKYPVTGEYKPIPHIWFQHPVDLPPFTFTTVRAMLMDEGIRLNFATREAPIYGLEFGWEENGVWQEGIKCRDPGVAQYIYRQLQRIWKNFLPDILRAQIWGWSAGEVTIKLSDETGLIEINEMLSRHPMDCRLLKDGCKKWGVQISRLEGTSDGAVNLPFPYCWFHAYGAEDGEDYGTSAAYGAYSPWADKWFEGGARDVRRLFMHKDAYGGVDIEYPPGETFIAGYERPIPNKDIARWITEQLRSGGVTQLPYDPDEHGNNRWKITRATVTSNPSHILDYPKDLDAEIRHGMGICDDVINSDATGAWAGKKIPMQSFYATLDLWVTKLLRDLCTQIIDNLLILNFGRVIEYETPFKPLAKQAMEQQGMGDGGQPNGTPQDMAGGPEGNEPGQTGIPGANDDPGQQQQPQPPEQQQQPYKMSLAEVIGRGEIDVRSVVDRAKRLAYVRLSADVGVSPDEDFEYTPERIEALAEILASVFGDSAEDVLDKIIPEDKPIKLAVWNPSDHPRGKNGRFIPKGTEEAYSAAKEKVDEAHRSRSPESMSALMSHLNTLTTKQLHSLKKDYGTKASAKTKSALIAKLTERLTSGKHRTAEREDGSPVAPVRENVYTVPTSNLQVDPQRFQYKVKGIGAKGVGEELKGTKTWNPELGGVLLVWRDPADGKDYVVNGHHRHELASRAGAESLNVRYIEAPTAKHARSVGALANIAEGRGSAIDAAKYLRDSGQDIDHLKRAGISMSGKVASDASNLVDLSDKAFAAVAQGKIDEDKAVAVGKHLKDHNLQDKLFKKIWQREDDGKDWSSREIEAAAKKMSRAGSITESGSDLFGDWESEESTFDQEVEIESYINKALSQEANDYAAVSSSRRAERVAGAGNVLNVEANLQQRDSARSTLSDFEREAGLKGPISEAIKTQAAKLARATKKSEKESIKKSALDEIRKLIEAMQEPDELKFDAMLDSLKKRTTPDQAFGSDDELIGSEKFKDAMDNNLFADWVGNFPKEQILKSAIYDLVGDKDRTERIVERMKTDPKYRDVGKESNSYTNAIAMSLLKGATTVSDWSLSAEEARQVEAEYRKMKKLGDTDQDTIMMSLQRLSVDATGHEHKGKGPGGGQFVSKGGSGGGSASSAAPLQKKDSPKSQGNQQTSKSPSGKSAFQAPNKEQGDIFDATSVHEQNGPEGLMEFMREKKLDKVIVDGEVFEMPKKKTGEAKPVTNDVPGTDIDEEQITPPPPGKAFQVDVEKAGPDGVALTARVGIPGRDVAPPPPIPKLPNLTKHERAVEQKFMDAFMSDPDGMAHKYRDLISKTSKPYTFETDQAKCLSDDWNDTDLDTQMKKRQLHNNALHQTANAIVKRAFLQHLNTLKPGDNVLVTVGGCGSGKGYTLKNTELGKNLTAEAKAVWDSAGDQNATENPWILEECEKRGLKVTYAYVAGDPKVSWADPNRGVVKRAHDNSDGRMVDAAVFADSYVMGAKNHHAFHQKNKNNPNAKFLFFSAKDQSTLDGVPEDSLKMDRKSLYHWAMGSIQSRTDVSPTVMRGATAGARIWNDELGA